MKRSPNLLLPLNEVSELNQVWVGAITSLPLEHGNWAYLCVWMDLYSRFIVGWKVATHMRTELVLQRFEQACGKRRPSKGLIVHSDGGGQLGSSLFRSRLTRSEFLHSMTRKDNHYDHAFIESLFSRLKAEMLEGGCFRNIEDANKECFEYIESYYNSLRRHSSLGYISPLAFENKIDFE